MRVMGVDRLKHNLILHTLIYRELMGVESG